MTRMQDKEKAQFQTMNASTGRPQANMNPNRNQAVIQGGRDYGMRSADERKFETYIQDKAGKADRDRLAKEQAAVQNRKAPTIAGTTLDTAPQAEMRGLQSTLGQQLLAQSQGQGPSLVAGQMKQAGDRNLAQNMAMAASGRGMNPNLLMRQAAMNQAQAGSALTRDVGQARMAEQLQAQNALGQVAGQSRTQDIGLAQAQAGLTMEQQLANQAAAQKQTAMNDQLRQFYSGSRTQSSQASQALRAQLDAEEQANYRAQFGGKGSSSPDYLPALIGAAGAVGAGFAASDARAKKNISDDKKEIASFIDNIKAYKYDYKDKADGDGSFVSPMAQDLEKSKIGAEMVEEGPDGKKFVNYARASGAMLASAAMLNDKQKELDKKIEMIMKKGRVA